jgi:hypothetical protein
MAGKKISMPFAVPLVRRKPTNHTDVCYFCQAKVEGYSAKNKKGIVYPNLPSAMRSVLHSDDLPVSSATVVSHSILQAGGICDNLDERDDEFQASASDCIPQLFSQPELNDLVRNLNLPKDAAGVLGSRIKAKNLLPPGTNFAWYRHHEQELISYFSEDGSMVYCKDINGLIVWFGVDYNASDWR